MPANAALVVVGDVQPDTITAALESGLTAWSPGPAPRQPDTSVAPASAVAPQDGLPDRQAGRRAVGLEGGQDRRSPQVARFLQLCA